MEEQRVATTAFVQRGEQFGLGALIAEQLRGELLGGCLAKWLQVQRHDGGPLVVWRPGDVTSRAHCSDECERMAAE